MPFCRHLYIWSCVHIKRFCAYYLFHFYFTLDVGYICCKARSRSCEAIHDFQNFHKKAGTAMQFPLNNINICIKSGNSRIEFILFRL